MTLSTAKRSGGTTTITISTAHFATRCTTYTTARATCNNSRLMAFKWTAMNSRFTAAAAAADSAPRHLQHDFSDVGRRLHERMGLRGLVEIEHLVNHGQSLAFFQ